MQNVSFLESQKVNSKRSLVMFSYYLEFKSECTVWKKASLPIARLEIKKFLAIARKEGKIVWFYT